ncbi:hypothetical protein EVAR_37866_1 [Eumeta japonica]|uniref:Uncharacterized protein n=1 Tax=Eumeta variegata TaxID=151549 RepID=A0A4C1X4F7_EUMVA|nr:hypothetical protein EVAR_37866_1 [Eumeta japonica]
MNSEETETGKNVRVQGQGYMVDALTLPNQTLSIFAEKLKMRATCAPDSHFHERLRGELSKPCTDLWLLVSRSASARHEHGPSPALNSVQFEYVLTLGSVKQSAVVLRVRPSAVINIPYAASLFPLLTSKDFVNRDSCTVYPNRY